MNMKIENIPAQNIAFIRRVGAYGGENELTMERLKGWADAKGLMSDDSIILGIARDDPANTAAENCRYDTCIVVSEDFCVSDGLVSLGIIDGGCYAVFEIAHTAEGVQQG